MKTMCLGLLLVAQAAAAQSLPDARNLLEREATALDSYATYSYIEETTTSTGMDASPAGTAGGGGGIAGLEVPIDLTQTTTVQAMNPGRRRMVTRMGKQEMQVVVADGRDTWLFMAPLGVYARLPEGADIVDALSGMGGLPSAIPALTASRVVRAETLQVDGVPHECWVVEARVDQIALGGIELRNLVTTVWIDKALDVSWRRTLSGRMQGGPLPGVSEIRTDARKRALELNGVVPESAFVFTPPPGARRDDSLLASVAADVEALIKPAAPARASAVPVSPDEPQAFVPILTPIEQVEPEWPATAREKGIQGIVEVLVTIDWQGRVTGVETLTGPQPLRAAAEAAVRQWRFHPVVRSGRQVAAYTTQVVTFFDHSNQPATPAIDVSEQLAATQRTEALARAWPRSKQDALADLENDLEGQGEGRRFFLPQLATAAWEAGAVEKAELYANEALSTMNPDGSVEGDAVHEAHRVLGLAAMKAGHVAVARQHLLDAGHTRGSASLNSFGPDLTLAQQLLAAGEKEAVLEYLTLCETFWQRGRPQLRDWRTTIEAGGKPTLNRFAAMQQAF